MNIPKPDPIEIKKVWRLIALEANSLIELRAISPNRSLAPITKQYRTRDFNTIDELKNEFERDAIRLNDEGHNIYTVMNPIKPDCINSAAKDLDILHRKWLLIDIDKTNSEKRPSTQFELNAAKSLVADIANQLIDKGWDDPGLVVMSGNGYHLYYDLGAMTNTAKVAAFVQEFLQGLAHRFDNSDVKVDQVVYNASRITKVVGTVARKGESTLETPYRIARMKQL